MAKKKTAAKKTGSRGKASKPGKRTSVSSISGAEAVKSLKEKQAKPKATGGSRKKTKIAKAKAKPHFKTNDEFLKNKQDNWLSYVDKRNAAEAVFEKYRDVILTHPDVTGAHIGVKRVRVEQDGEIRLLVGKPLTFAICIHVVKKLDDKTKCSWPLPEHFDGVPTDIVEGKFARSNSTLPSDTKTIEVADMQGAVAIGLKGSNEFGTVGYVVHAGPFEFYLTNEHVAPEGSDVVQPPNSDRVIGTTVQANKALDAALINPTGNLGFKKTILGLDGVAPEFISNGVLGVPDENKSVWVIGAATNKTKGEVESISGSVTVEDQGEFQNQIIVDSIDGQPITDEGNSGGLVIIERTRGSLVFYEIVGLVHALANGGNRVAATPIKEVVDRFGVEFN